MYNAYQFASGMYLIICGYVYRSHIVANSIMFLEQSSSKNVFYIGISIALWLMAMVFLA